MTSPLHAKTEKLPRRHKGRGSVKRTRASRSCDVYIVAPAANPLGDVRRTAAPSACRIRTKSELVKEFASASKYAVWVAADFASLAPLAAHASSARGEQRLLVLDEMTEISHHVFSALFRYVVTASAKVRLLPPEELVRALTSSNREDLFIGGAVDKERGVVLLYRGTVDPLVVPLSWFSNRASETKVDPDRFDVADYGQTVKLGAFEAAADAILYEFDASFRRAAKKRALQKDKSLGSAIRRLRLQRGLRRSDFPKLTEKEIARIERNEVKRPRTRTLEAIAETLGVSTDELTSY